MDNIETTTGLGDRQFRPRRPHTKSRAGCAQCRQRRIKCDELKPRCTRCDKGDLFCKYPSSSLIVTNNASPESQATTPGELACTVSTMAYRLRPPDHEDDAQLFHHYILHTSHAINFDPHDSFALQVGIPELAAHCPALMSSILAIAAACCCCDIMSHPALVPRDRDRVVELLAVANRHHLKSLQEIQATITNTDHYDQILANALLMAAYGTASQRVRIWLATTTTGGETLADEFLPTNSEWMSLFHAMDAAYATVPRNPLTATRAGSEDGETASSFSSSTSAYRDPRTHAHDEEVILPMQQPMALTSHVLFPILAATSSIALDRLNRSIDRLWFFVDSPNNPEAMSPGGVAPNDTHSRETLVACRTAMDVLLGVAAKVSPLQNTFPDIPQHTQRVQSDVRLRSRLSNVSDWLRIYISRVLGETPSKPLRRIVMAFLYRVPQRFVNAVRAILDAFPPGPSFMPWDNAEHRRLKLTPVEALAIDICAHWLAFTLLLDGVWFIGDIGFWELGRIVTMVRTQQLHLPHTVELDQDWWPASIYNVSVEVRKYMRGTPGR